MSGQLRETRKRTRTRRNRTIGQIERLEGRTLLASIAEFGVTTGSQPNEITSGPDGNLWFNEQGTSKVGEITTSGDVTEFSLTTGSDPGGITAGPDGNLWFVEAGTNKIVDINPTTHAITEFSNGLSSNAGLTDITAGPDGDLWFTEYNTDKIGKIDPSNGNITEYSVESGDSPHGITVGPDGALWATANIGNHLIRITTTGSVSEHTVPGGGNPVGITTGSDGNLWFTRSNGDAIDSYNLVDNSFTSYTVPTSGSFPLDIAPGPLGDLYFTENSGNKIGQITTSGTVSEYDTPRSSSAPAGIAVGPDNHVWFAEISADNIGRLNLAPTAVNQTYTAGENTPLAVNIANGLLNNGSDPEGDSLSVAGIGTPSHGTMMGNPNGSFTYTPGASFTGTDSFSYQITDGTDDSNTATVTIHVDAPPVAVNDSYNAIENTPLSVNAANGVLANDTDPQSLPLTAVLVANPSHFSSFSFNTSTGAFSYTPAPGFYGTDSFTYKANDGYSDGNTATVTIMVDAPPVAVNDSYNAIENTPQGRNAANGVLANDTQAQGDPLTAAIVANPSHGTVTLNPDGSFSYTPNANFLGTDSFTYQDNDGYQIGNTATVSLRVDAPPVDVNDTYRYLLNTALSDNAASGVLANDTQAQGDPLTAAIVANPSHGTVTLNPDGSFTYTPNNGYTGGDSFTYQDNDGYQNGNTATVNLTLDHPPVAVAEGYTAIENTTLTKNALTGVLANDTDADDDPLVAIDITNPAHGTLTLNADGSFTYTPNANFFGTDSFTYKPNDGSYDGNTVTVSLTVDAQPVAVNDSYSANEDISLAVPLAGGVLANDTQAQGNTLTAVLVTSPAHGSLTLNADGSFSYIPNVRFAGSDSFTYHDSDGITAGNTATVTINVAQDVAPVASSVAQAAGEGSFTATAPGVLANDTDINGQPLTALLVSGPAHGTLNFNGDGSYTYVPNSSFGTTGSDSFTYRAFDGVLTSGVATVTLTFDGTYLPPVAQPLAFTVAEGVTLTETAQAGLLSGANDYWTLPLTANVTNQPTHGTLAANADGSFTYIPTAGYFGADSFTYEANNSHVSSTAQTVNLTVTQVFQPPVAVNDAYATTTGQPPLAVPTASGLLANDSDPQGETLTAVLVASPAHGHLAFFGAGSFSYLPDLGFSGADTFSYQDFNGQFLSNVATVTITVHLATTPPPPPAVPGDYDGDGKADVAVYIPALGAFEIKDSSTGTDQIIQFGTPGLGNAIPAPGDYDHSGKTELAVYLPASGDMIYRPASGGTDVVTQFGSPGLGLSIPTPGDYYKTGQTDVAVYLATSGVFAIKDPTGNTPGQMVQFGMPGLGLSIPAPGDYYGSGRSDLAVYMPTIGAFAVQDPSGNTPGEIVPFGMPGLGKSIPMPGDYDGSGKTELAVYIPSLGEFFYRPANGGADVGVKFGSVGAGQTLPSPGDYTGVGHDELAAYLPASGIFAIQVPEAFGPEIPIGLPGQGQTFPVAVVDAALAQMPSNVSSLSISIPDLQFPATRRKNG